MNGILGSLKSAKKIEWLILLAAAAFLALLFMGDGETASSTDTEARLAYVLSSVEGAGEVRVMVQETGGEVLGVLVVAEGADDVRVVLSITNAVHKLLGVDMQSIEVIKMDRNMGG